MLQYINIIDCTVLDISEEVGTFGPKQQRMHEFGIIQMHVM